MRSSRSFARRILARWERRIVSPRPLGLVLVRPQRGASVLWRRSLEVRLAPRIALTIVRPERLEAAFHRSESATTVVRDARAATQLRVVACERAERILERTLTRATRVETVPGAGPGGREPAPAAAVVAPAAAPWQVPAPLVPVAVPPPVRATSELIVRRERELNERLLERTLHEHVRSQDAPSLGVQSPAAPQLDVARLTDTVVAAIDARLHAHAERLGRD